MDGPKVKNRSACLVHETSRQRTMYLHQFHGHTVLVYQAKMDLDQHLEQDPNELVVESGNKSEDTFRKPEK